jgi:hypothetical protein
VIQQSLAGRHRSFLESIREIRITASSADDTSFLALIASPI